MPGFWKRWLDHLWPPPIRLQLTIWYLGIFTLLITIAGALFYGQLSTGLARSLDTTLQARTQQIAAGIAEERDSIRIHDVTGELPGITESEHEQGSIPPPPPNPSGSSADVNVGTLVRVLRADGQVVYATPAFRALHPPAESVSQPLHRKTAWMGTITANNGQLVRLASVPLLSHGTVYGVIQVGESLAVLQSTLNSVGIAFGLIAPIALLLSALGSFWLAARAFSPIRRLTQTAQRIEAGDLQQRVPVPRARDEVHTLAVTFNAMIKRLERAFAQQRRFVSHASHELRTPIAAIRSMAEVTLAQPTTPEVYITTLQEIDREAERLGRLVGDLLALARADEGHTLFEQRPLRLDVLATEVVATIEPIASERGLLMTLGRLDPAIVLGDEARLIQVIFNLLENALAYTPCPGTVTVKVIVEQQQAQLTVTDTGIGITPDQVVHVFERFYRTDAARSRNTGGSGLGLSIVEWIVRAHGGNVTVESLVGQGSTFTVHLPLVVPLSPAQKGSLPYQ